MTQILFFDNKFWLYGMEIVYCKLLPVTLYINTMTNMGAFMLNEPYKKLEPGDTFPLTENLSYEVKEEQIPCPDKLPGCAVYHFKKVVRLKLKQMKNETPEDGVEKPDIIKFLCGEQDYEGAWYGDKVQSKTPYWWRKPLREYVESLQKENEKLRNDLLDIIDLKNGKGSTALSIMNAKIQELQKENEELKNKLTEEIRSGRQDWEKMQINKISYLESVVLESLDINRITELRADRFNLINKISDLESQLVNAKELLGNVLAESNQYGYIVMHTIGQIESFLSTNEVKE